MNGLLFDLDEALPAHCQSAPFQSHSETSKAAAIAIQPHLGRMQMAVWLWLKDHPGSTDNELIAAGVVSANGSRARRVELVRKGIVKACGERDGSTLWRVV